MLARQLDKIRPVVADDVVLWLGLSEVSLMKQVSNSNTAGRAGLWVVWAELHCARGMMQTMAVTIRWDLSVSPLLLTHHPGHARHPPRKKTGGKLPGPTALYAMSVVAVVCLERNQDTVTH